MAIGFLVDVLIKRRVAASGGGGEVIKSNNDSCIEKN